MRSTPEGIYSIKGSSFEAIELPEIHDVRGKGLHLLRWQKPISTIINRTI